ncbi:MAG: hypothetical protein WC956_10105 [bacterium]
MILKTTPILPPIEADPAGALASQPTEASDATVDETAAPAEAAQDAPPAPVAAAETRPPRVRTREEGFMIHAESLTIPMSIHLPQIKGPERRIAFLRRIMQFVAFMPTDYLRFSPSARIVVYAFVANSADDLRTSFPNQCSAENRGGAVADLITKCFVASYPLEARLLSRDEFTDRASWHMAEIHAARAKNVTYMKAITYLAAGSKAGNAFLAMTILQLHNASWRFKGVISRYPDLNMRPWDERRMIRNAMDRDKDNSQTLRDIKESFRSMPDDELTWAIDTAQKLIKSGARRVASFPDDSAEKRIAAQSYMKMVDEIAAGIYLFSPMLFEMCADALREHGLPDFAQMYSRRAALDRDLSRRL